MQTDLREGVLISWVKLSGILKNTRITKGLLYNEAIVMLLLYNRYRRDGEGIISIKEITQQTKMLKSLVNRTVNSLEKKNLLQRCDAAGDRRMVYVRCVKEKLDVFLRVHNNSLALVDNLIDIVGADDARAFVRISEKIENSGYTIK